MEISDMENMYQYKESGLDNIYLVNGFTERQTSRGRSVSIEDLDGLHRAIGEWLARDKKILDGREARFLRLEMGLSQVSLAVLLGKDEQSIARWEKKRLSENEAIPADSERMIRYLYLEFIGRNTPMREFLEALANLEFVEEGRTSFSETDTGWEQEDLQAA
jgi:putative transcriptional regulator